MHKEIRDKVEECIVKAERFYGREFRRPRIEFNLKGRVAGHCCLVGGEPSKLRFNVPLAVRNRDSFLNDTVPHEVAHWIQYSLYKGVKPHGREWKRIMVSVFKLAPKRCHRYDTSETQVRKNRTFKYVCRCKEWELTSIRHNKIQRKKATYHCPKCGDKLTRLISTRKLLTPEEL